MRKIFFFLLLIGVLAACKKKTNIAETAEMVKLPDDFRAFYKKFHEDTLYQHQHIQFPIQGLPQDVDSATVAENDFFYTEDVWKNHKAIDFSQGEFRQSLTALTERMIRERIYKTDNTYGLERRFAKLSDNEWYLIYYIAPNHFSTQ
jgi:hypothetical protein